MLVDQDTESKLLEVLEALVGAFSLYSTGRALGQTVLKAAAAATSARAFRLSYLEQSFLAGKIATVIGEDNLARMSSQEIETWIKSNQVELNDNDQATLNQLKADTERWFESRRDQWKAKFRQTISNANKQYTAALRSGNYTEAAARQIARNSALEEMKASLQTQSEYQRSDVDRLIQGEMAHYFQAGQTVDLPDDEEVMKIPRAAACKECLRLHLNEDGSPKVFKLSELRQNSNVGLPAYAWQPTVGPVHPYCYCKLVRVATTQPQPSDELASALEESKKPKGRSQGMQKTAPADDEILDLLKASIQQIRETRV